MYPADPSSSSSSSQASQAGTADDLSSESSQHDSTTTLSSLAEEASISSVVEHSSSTHHDDGARDNAIPASSPSKSAIAPDEQAAPDPLHECIHTIHPAHSDTYLHSMCPTCRLDTCVRNAEYTEGTTMEGGGSLQWQESVLQTPQGEEFRKELDNYKFWKGRRKMIENGGTKNVHRIREWVSYPRSRTALLNTVAELEKVRDLEQGWEKRNPSMSLDVDTQQQLARSSLSSATYSLERYHSHVKDNTIGIVEKNSIDFSRKRARPDYPSPQDPLERGFLNRTADQQTFIDMHLVLDNDSSDDHDEDSVPPKRKRHRLDANVEFDPHIYVRTEADIDMLHKPSTSPSAAYLEDSPKITPELKSILRTSPRHMHPLPKRPHNVVAVTSHKQVSAKRSWKRWSVGPGYTKIDTSGLHMDWHAWGMHVMALHAEVIEAGNGVDVDVDEDVPLQSGGSERAAVSQRGELDGVETEVVGRERQALTPRRQATIPEKQITAPKWHTRTQERRIRTAPERDARSAPEPAAQEAAPAEFRPHSGITSAAVLDGVVAEGVRNLARSLNIL